MPFEILKQPRSTHINRKVIFVINHIDWFWSHRYSLAKAVQDEGFDVYVACANATNDTALKQEGFKPLDLPSLNGNKNPTQILKLLSQIRSYVVELKPDIVHAITIKYAFLTGLALIGKNNHHNIFTIAGLGYLFSDNNFKAAIIRTFLTPVFRLAFGQKRTSFIFQNENDMKTFLDRSFSEQINSTLIKGSGVNTHKFFYSQEPLGKEPVVFMPTRLVKEKGIHIFAEAAKIVHEKRYEAKFVLAGGLDETNPSALTLKDLEEFFQEGHVIWRGKIVDMPRMYKRANIVVYPSYYKEGVPKVLLEAAASGRAIITTDHPGCRDVVEHERSGLLVPVKDAHKTALAIMDLLDNDVKRYKMGRYAREKACAEFDVHLINENTIEIYDKVLRELSSPDQLHQDAIQLSSS